PLAGEDVQAPCCLENHSLAAGRKIKTLMTLCMFYAILRPLVSEGKSLTLEEMWGTIHPNFRLCLRNSPLNAISQQEHPLLGQPFFFLHPCRTEEFMGPVLQVAQDQGRPVNYVLSWLSVVGPVVGLDVSLKYSTNLPSADSLSDTQSDRS
uniref:Ubiquitin-like-conjugating enzyme ATG10 n=1 Tax=Fundulus heteroclitus TaxID=8078 RepID=A0A3Q2NRC0_FUNHE